MHNLEQGVRCLRKGKCQKVYNIKNYIQELLI